MYTGSARAVFILQGGERMARKKKAMDFSSLDLNLDALGDWGGGAKGRAKDRRKLYVANRRNIRLYNRRTGKGKRYAKPGTRDLEF
jgi:hypothetical protein